MREIIGWLLLLLPFVGLGIFMRALGLMWEFLAAIAFLALIVGCIVSGCYLLGL